MIRPLLPLALAAALAACTAPPEDGPLSASVIGEAPRITDPSRKPLTPTSAFLLSATAQGLVRFDASGQIEPGLAIRWDVSDDGLYYTFRLADDAGIDAAQAARWLRSAIGPTSRNPLQPVLGAIAQIVDVTPEVIEIRLNAPRPDLLSLLAQPELAILSRGVGSGPFRIARGRTGTAILTPIAIRDEDLEPEEIARRQLSIRFERASAAIVRFRAGATGLVLGGRFTDVPLLRAARLPADALRVDPTSGLFGLEVRKRGGFVAVAENRRALSMAIDRAALADAFGPAGLSATATLLPAGLSDTERPSRPDWIDTPLTQRRDIARRIVVGRGEAREGPPVVRVALPPGPGGRLLLARLARDWAVIGVAVLSATDGDADLALVDLVAPGSSASWYLRRFACERAIACSLEADRALEAARAAPTLAERSRKLADADARLTEISAFIPLSQPLRWSLVTRSYGGFQANARAAHPLDQLRP